jgi:hypothetical protein
MRQKARKHLIFVDFTSPVGVINPSQEFAFLRGKIKIHPRENGRFRISVLNISISTETCRSASRPNWARRLEDPNAESALHCLRKPSDQRWGSRTNWGKIRYKTIWRSIAGPTGTWWDTASIAGHESNAFFPIAVLFLRRVLHEFNNRPIDSCHHFGLRHSFPSRTAGPNDDFLRLRWRREISKFIRVDDDAAMDVRKLHGVTVLF